MEQGCSGFSSRVIVANRLFSLDYPLFRLYRLNPLFRLYFQKKILPWWKKKKKKNLFEHRYLRGGGGVTVPGSWMNFWVIKVVCISSLCWTLVWLEIERPFPYHTFYHALTCHILKESQYNGTAVDLFPQLFLLKNTRVSSEREIKRTKQQIPVKKFVNNIFIQQNWIPVPLQRDLRH